MQILDGKYSVLLSFYQKDTDSKFTNMMILEGYVYEENLENFKAVENDGSEVWAIRWG